MSLRAVVCLLWLIGSIACRDAAPVEIEESIVVPEESLIVTLLDGATLEISAPEGVLEPGFSTHTVVSHGPLVVVAETARESWGKAIVAEMLDPEEEPYRGGTLVNGEWGGARVTVWIGDNYSMLVGRELDDEIRLLLQAMDIAEEPNGIVARGRARMVSSTVTVPFRRGVLDVSPAQGPKVKEVTVERDPGGKVIGITVAYPTASATSYFPPFIDGAPMVDVVESIEVEWRQP